MDISLVFHQLFITSLELKRRHNAAAKRALFKPVFWCRYKGVTVSNGKWLNKVQQRHK